MGVRIIVSSSGAWETLISEIVMIVVIELKKCLNQSIFVNRWILLNGAFRYVAADGKQELVNGYVTPE